MKTSTVILGASCYGLGLVMADADSVLIERGASAGDEFFNSYRPCDNWNGELKSTEVVEFRNELYEKCGGEDNIDFYAFAPILYYKLKDISSRIMMTTEIVSMSETSTGFELKCCNPGGTFIIECEKIIDCTPTCISNREWGKNNITAKYLNASVFSESGEFPEFTKFYIGEGRSANERFIGIELPVDLNWTGARKFFMENYASENFGEVRIASIAKQFDYQLNETEHEFSCKHRFISPLEFNNPLTAFDAGMAGR